MASDPSYSNTSKKSMVNKIIMLKISSNKLLFSGIISAILILGLTLSISGFQFNNFVQAQCQENSIFDASMKKSESYGIDSRKIPGLYLDNQGTIQYLYDNFDTYSDNQIVLDHFENIDLWIVNDKENQLSHSNEYYGGHGAASLAISNNQDLMLSKKFEQIQNLKKFEKYGFITLWMNIEDTNSIDSVNVFLEDKFGNTREYSTLVNVHNSSENTFGDDLAYPDLTYPEGNSDIEEWTDFRLAPGWNYLLWRTDKFTDTGHVDLSQIQMIHLKVKLNDKSTNQNIIFDDLRIQNGLQKNSNPTNGVWFPPHGRPQYGVYDIDQNPANSHDYELHLLNVRNSQYITNGDHARMISAAPVPENFALRVKFSLSQLGLSDKDTKFSFPYSDLLPSEWLQFSNLGQRDNSYFRVTYDFEPDWDPGHDWFGAYLSLQYDRFGLVSVWPVVRSLEQDQEPKKGNPLATNTFSPKENVMYQMDLVVNGQQTTAAIYEIQDGCLVPKSSIGYTFEHSRHGPNERYPIAIESTGNMRTIIYEVEMVSLGKPDVKKDESQRFIQLQEEPESTLEDLIQNYQAIRSNTSGCNCAAFRLDDIQDYWLTDSQIEVMEIFNERDIPLTIGIIGNKIGDDEGIVSYIQQRLPSDLLEIANHGWNHEHFTEYNLTTQSLFIKNTNTNIQKIFGITPSVFIPPYNEFNADTIYAMNKNHITYFSSSTSQSKPPYNLKNSQLNNFPEAASTGKQTYKGSLIEGISYDITLYELHKSISERGFAVIMMHPQEFSIVENGKYSENVNWNQIKELELLLDRLKIEGIDIVPISKIDYDLE